MILIRVTLHCVSFASLNRQLTGGKRIKPVQRLLRPYIDTRSPVPYFPYRVIPNFGTRVLTGKHFWRTLMRTAVLHLVRVAALCTLIALTLVLGIHDQSIHDQVFAAQPVSQQAAQTPHPYLQSARPLQIDHLGTKAAVDALATGAAQPLSLAAADVDADGVDDLLVGYGTPDGGGVVALPPRN